jgi:predicted metalloendopeptidase
MSSAPYELPQRSSVWSRAVRAAYRAATVRNFDAWYAAFDVRPGQRLYPQPAARLRIG